MDGNPRPNFSKEQIPLLEKEILRLKEKLHGDYPDATSGQLEIAIGNAFKAVSNPLDQEQVEKMTRHHLGSTH